MSEPKLKRGFATLTPERLHELAVAGGKSLRPEQRAFSQNRDLAKAAGKKGGNAPKAPRRRRARAHQPTTSEVTS